MQIRVSLIALASVFISTFLIAGPLHDAAEKGDLTKVKQLIDEVMDVNARDKDGFTSLDLAARKGHTLVAELLISKGAKVNVKDSKGETPLVKALHEGHKDVAKLLRQHVDKDR